VRVLDNDMVRVGGTADGSGAGIIIRSGPIAANNRITDVDLGIGCDTLRDDPPAKIRDNIVTLVTTSYGGTCLDVGNND
jgi:hypothetical protein